MPLVGKKWLSLIGHGWPYAAKHRDVLERALRLPKSDRLLVPQNNLIAKHFAR